MNRLKIRPLLIATAVVIFICTSAVAQPIKRVPTSSANADYVQALFTADKFLYAWKTRNFDEGIKLLTPRLTSEMSNDDLRAYISGTSSPSHAAFEVSNGRKIADSKYAFKVKLYEYYYAATPESQSWKCPENSRIVLVKVGVIDEKLRVGNWQVDELPVGCELGLR